MIDTAKVGRAIAQLRRDAGMTQAELAERLYVTHQSVSKWETGAALPDITTLHALSRLMNVSLDDLLAGSVQPRTYSRWQALEAIGAYLSGDVRDMLFDSALRLEPPSYAIARRLLRQDFLSDEQRAALEAALDAAPEADTASGDQYSD